MLLVDYARATVSVACGSRYRGYHLGWSTDGEKRDALEAAGATIIRCPLHGRSGPEFGWEISFREGTQVGDEQAASPAVTAPAVLA